MRAYHRYQIETHPTPNLIDHPHRFNVRVNRWELAKLLVKELAHYRGNLEVVLSRPCVYGVFSGPIGGFSPREKKCVGCLRCTTEHPDIVSILHNPERRTLGDAYFTPEHVDTATFEAETGHIPIKGQGYRGKFGGTGWDGMWTDMSEIVRPTRDGIHGREFISTEVDIGGKPPFLQFPNEEVARTVSIPIPLLFEATDQACVAICEAARHLQTFAVVPLKLIVEHGLKGNHIIPWVTDAEELKKLNFSPLFFETEKPNSSSILRTDFEEDLLPYYKQGVRVFHLVANYHGRSKNGTFVLDLIRQAHASFVKAGYRDEVTLIGSGGIIAAEHVPKAILCGLDAVGLDTTLLVALQARFKGPCIERDYSHFELPINLSVEWGAQRLKNLACSWRDQLLEILGAMGLREVRRLRGEMGRAFFQKDLEQEAFQGIEGYE